MNVCLAYYDEEAGIWRILFSSLWVHYAKSWLVVDALSVFPYDLVAYLIQSSSFGYAHLVRLVRLLRLLKLVRLLKTSRFVHEHTPD